MFSSSKPTTEIVNMVKSIIDNNAVVVFSKTYCPYCASTKRKLKSMGVNYALIELDQESDGSAMQNALEDLTGQRTVPNVFIGQKHIGGNSEVQALASSGKLEQILAEAGVGKA
ncbi:hypothetical protein N3K66_007838 [Trichothecium roseum]|uniref:Uncharacterized protein n=1 Tax=Trichothecium roseum TaxID=47278 RepID=A0ACC0URR8_9HYPO|nr:hypothetical protein N3K66_007838 [Trichothecium roseum]